jgi:hypothetical protein
MLALLHLRCAWPEQNATRVAQLVEAQVAKCIARLEQSVTRAVVALIGPMLEQLTSSLGDSLRASITQAVVAATVSPSQQQSISTEPQ